jgi:hypothetical protein
VICTGDCQAPLVDLRLGGGESEQTYPGETIDLSPNTIYAVSEFTTAFGHSPYEDGPYDPTQDSGSADAFVDPTFTLRGQYASATISRVCRTSLWRVAFPSSPLGRCC